MDPLPEKVTRLVETRLKDGMADLELTPDGVLLGHIISSSFEDMEFADRRRLLREILQDALSPDELKRTQLFLTYTPEEWNVTL